MHFKNEYLLSTYYISDTGLDTVIKMVRPSHLGPCQQEREHGVTQIFTQISVIGAEVIAVKKVKWCQENIY